MKLKSFSISGVEFLREIGFWLGTASLTLQVDGEEVAHVVTVRVRAKGTVSQTFSEVGQAIQDQSIEVLSQAIAALRAGNSDELHAKAVASGY